MNQRYQFAPQDGELLWSANVLLQKIITSGKIRPAQMVTLAKLQHVFSILPSVTEGVTASVSVCCPRHKFGVIETFHWWDFGIEDGRMSITSMGHFYDPMTGGDTFTTMDWVATPEKPTETNDFRESLFMVPDIKSYAEVVDGINFSVDGYTIEVLDNDNPLLDDQADDVDDTENDDKVSESIEERVEDAEEGTEAVSSESWSITPVDAFETWIASQVDPLQVDAREPAYTFDVDECGICGCDLNKRGLHVDGRLRGDLMWSNMCTDCLKTAGEGIGWGKGQLYARQPNGDWRLVAGFQPEEE